MKETVIENIYSLDTAKQYAEVFHRMVEGLINPIMVLDDKQNIVYINRTMEETFGTLLGRHWSFLFTDDAVNRKTPIQELIQKKRTGRAEAVLADVTYDLLFTSVTDEAGTPYIVVMFDDISEKKYLEAQLKQSVRKLKNETDIAKHIQNSILPINDEYWNSIRITSVYLPADDLGGDVFDIIKLSKDETLLYIADVSGHGIQASLLTMFVREKVRAKIGAAKNGLDMLIRELLKGFNDLEIDAMLYLSILFCKYDRSRGDLSIANAGHNCYPLVIRENGRVEEIPVRGMPISRISETDSYSEEIIGMRPGDRLILYTDGVIEEYSKTEKKMFGSEGVRRIAEKFYNYEGEALAKTIIDEASAHTIFAPKDDRTIIVADML